MARTLALLLVALTGSLHARPIVAADASADWLTPGVSADLKARFSLTLEIPAGWDAVSPDAEEHRTEDPSRTDLHASALAWLERYTGIPYPWGKFDFFLAPAFQFGGMEHAGAIVYNAPGLLLDESASRNQLLGRASLIGHETAHMRLGDLVTMRWFDDVWMKEVFANFIAAKIVNPSFPEVNHDLRFFLAHDPGA